LERARVLLLGDDFVPARISEALRRGEFGVESLRDVSIELALTRCTLDGDASSGSVSHAWLGVHAAMRIEKRCGAPTRDLLWVTVAWLVAREVARSPYTRSPFLLPEPGLPTVSLAEAIRQGDVAAPDAAASGGRVRAELVGLAMAQFGHLGHGALFAATTLALGDAYGALPDRCGRRTFHHSIKLVSAMMHRPAARALTVDFLASAWNGQNDTVLDPALQILGIDRS
jgi:hypothetical protein